MERNYRLENDPDRTEYKLDYSLKYPSNRKLKKRSNARHKRDVYML